MKSNFQFDDNGFIFGRVISENPIIAPNNVELDSDDNDLDPIGKIYDDKSEIVYGVDTDENGEPLMRNGKPLKNLKKIRRLKRKIRRLKLNV